MLESRLDVHLGVPTKEPFFLFSTIVENMWKFKKTLVYSLVSAVFYLFLYLLSCLFLCVYVNIFILLTI